MGNHGELDTDAAPSKQSVLESPLTLDGATILGTQGMQLHCLAIQGNITT